MNSIKSVGEFFFEKEKGKKILITQADCSICEECEKAIDEKKFDVLEFKVGQNDFASQNFLNFLKENKVTRTPVFVEDSKVIIITSLYDFLHLMKDQERI